jgi:hypothetical protein
MDVLYVVQKAKNINVLFEKNQPNQSLILHNFELEKVQRSICLCELCADLFEHVSECFSECTFFVVVPNSRTV